MRITFLQKEALLRRPATFEHGHIKVHLGILVVLSGQDQNAPFQNDNIAVLFYELFMYPFYYFLSSTKKKI